jgi:hypothetical protein
MSSSGEAQPPSQTSRPDPGQPGAEPAQSDWQRFIAACEGRDTWFEIAAKDVADAIHDGWAAAVAERVAKYVTHQTWQRLLTGSHRRRCERLAQLANKIREGKTDLHHAVGQSTTAIGDMLGLGRVERVFAAELADRIPPPGVDELDEVARSIRITGVMLCLSADRNLRQCACFCDLGDAEGQEGTKRLLLSAANNYWTAHYQLPD